MKKNYLFLGLLIIVSCVGCVNNTSSFANNLISKMESFYNNRKFKVTIEYQENIDSYFIDGKSYHHVNNNTTVYKYQFLDNYQMYKDNELLDENYILETDIPEDYIALLNPLRINDYNFEIIENEYILKDALLDEYKVPLFDNEITSLRINLINDEIIYDYIFKEDVACKIIFSNSEYNINYYLHNQDEYDNYYENYKLSYDALKNKLDNKESFGLIITYNKCASCMRAEALYYEFFLEYNLTFFNTISTDELSKENRTKLNQLVSEAYENQDSKFKHQSYEEYPDSFLTPSACRIVDGVFKYVLPGFVTSMKDLLYSLCFE